MQCLYRSLAASYRDSITNLEKITGRVFSKINLVGGGSKDEYLNRLTATVAGLPVYAGPAEATVIGNLVVQMISGGLISSLAAARQIIAGSFTIEQF
jgi:rhamnulokinase